MFLTTPEVLNFTQSLVHLSAPIKKASIGIM